MSWKSWEELKAGDGVHLGGDPKLYILSHPVTDQLHGKESYWKMVGQEFVIYKFVWDRGEHHKSQLWELAEFNDDERKLWSAYHWAGK